MAALVSAPISEDRSVHEDMDDLKESSCSTDAMDNTAESLLDNDRYNSNINPDGGCDDDAVLSVPPVRVNKVDGDDASNPYILDETQMNDIAKRVLPVSISYCRWRRLYSLSRDGDSFEGCLRIVGTAKRTLVVVRTSKGDVFGGYADAPWHSTSLNSTAKFYGTASSCLFSFPSSSFKSRRTASSSPTSSSSPEKCSSSSSSALNVYRWTGKNRYVQVCDVSHKLLAFGGGGNDGTFGLCLQDDFQRGTTGPCNTFDNEPLCEDGDFDVVDVEFWEFLTGVF